MLVLVIVGEQRVDVIIASSGQAWRCILQRRGVSVRGGLRGVGANHVGHLIDWNFEKNCQTFWQASPRIYVPYFIDHLYEASTVRHFKLKIVCPKTVCSKLGRLYGLHTVTEVWLSLTDSLRSQNCTVNVFLRPVRVWLSMLNLDILSEMIALEAARDRQELVYEKVMSLERHCKCPNLLI